MPAVVEIFWCDMDRMAVPDEEVSRILSPGERLRATKFRSARLGTRYLLRRVLLRRLLSERLGCRPEEVILTCGPYGKPSVAGGPAFNISHSEELLLIGIAPGGNLGVDIEVVREMDSVATIAERCFSSTELCEWRAISPDHRQRAFFRGWARKEALIKASGDGLSLPLESFTVSLREGTENALIDAGGILSFAQCLVLSVPLDPRAEAAVAWDTGAFELRVTFLDQSSSSWLV